MAQIQSLAQELPYTMDVAIKKKKKKKSKYKNDFKNKEVKKNLFLPFRAAPMAYGGSQSRD